jgi:dipeptidyl aminopeptidase/acylaminoacyl peptidase
MRKLTGVAALLLMIMPGLVLGELRATAQATAAVAPARFELTVDSVMRGPKLVGYPPSELRWSGDSRRLYFEWRQPGDKEAATWVVNRDGSGLRRLSDSERRSVPATAATWDSRHRRALFVESGDIVLVDSIAGTRRSITRTTAAEANPRWARNERTVTFTRESNLYEVPLEPGLDSAGSLVQLTDVRPRPADSRESESQKFLKAQEQQLLDHTRADAEKKKKEEADQKARALPRFDLRDRQSVSDLQLSPDGSHVFLLVIERGEAKRPDVPNYVTASGYAETSPARINVGDVHDKQTLAVLNLETGTSHFADSSFAGDGREVFWSMPIVNADGSLAVTAVRAVNNKDRWLVAVDPKSGRTRVVDRQHDDAWIREPGGNSNAEPASHGWLPDQKHLWFLSERDGWMHLYAVDASISGGAPRQLTRGAWEVFSVAMSAAGRKFYLTTNEVHPGERQIVTMPLDGGERSRLTTATGSHEGAASPDDAIFADVHSYANRPPELFLMPNLPGAAARLVTTSPTAEWRSFNWIDPQIVTYPTRDGLQVHARLYTPEMIGARRDLHAPAVIFTHGSGYLQDAHKYWSTYSREYMFNNLLAAEGYVVLDPDFRASAGYGRDWRTAIYRHMGGKDLDDVVDGAKFLVDAEHVDSKRIGIYGGSYGGFLTLMALFTSPDTFAAGAALRPVSDWSHYNHPYTSNILNEPQSDPEAYRVSSPIYFAAGLTKPLLIGHGMVDTNVLFQDTVRLVQRLIELRKENFEVAPFPVENHAFEEETSWADEYKRVLRLFDANLKGKS